MTPSRGRLRFFPPTCRVLFSEKLFFFLLSSHRWQTTGRKLLAKAAIAQHL